MSQALHILILEDRPADHELAALELRQAGIEFTAQWVMTEADFRAGLRDPALGLILADYSLPGYDGMSALALARQERPEVPFIFVSGSMGEETAIDALHHGATDYVLKDRLGRLGPAVRRALREVEERRRSHQAEQDRRESEARFRVLFEQSPDGIVIIDPETMRIIEFNEAAHRLLGYSREEFSRLSIPDVEARESAAEIRARLQEVVRQGGDDFDTRHRTREGEIRDVHVTVRVIELMGRPVFFGLWRDVTERKQAEAALREAEERYRGLFEHAAEGVFQSTPDGRLLAVNPAFAAIHGYGSPAECVAAVQDIARQFYVEPARRDAFRRQLEQLGKVTNFENQVRRKDGSVIWVSTSARVIRDSQGKAVRYEGFVEDITERKHAEARIQHLNQLLRAIRDVNTLIVREGDPERLLVEACHILLRSRDYRLVWIGQTEPGTMRVVPAARAGEQGDYLDQVTMTWDDSATGRGPIGTAMRTGCPNWIQDIATDPRFEPWREAALARGYASVAAAPLIQDGRVLGALVVYAGQKNAFNEEEMGLLNELAGDLAFALQHIEHEQERRMAEAELVRMTRLHVMVLEAAGQGILGLDANGKHTFANPAAARMLGCTVAELIGQPSQAIWRQPMSEGGPCPAESSPGGGALEVETTRPVTGTVVRRKDGSSFLTEFISNPIVEHGMVVGAVVVFTDITERNQTESRLQLQSAALEAAANGMIITDREGTIIWANPAFTRMTGYAAGEAVGLNPRLLKSGVQDEAFYQELWRTILAGNVWHGEVRNQRKDGSLYDEEMTIAPVRDAQGRVSHFIAIKQDITEKKALEKRMLRAQRMESIGQLAGGIAHDLNNVLAPIRMSVDLLRPEVKSPETRKTLDILQTSAERGAGIVQQVLTFARGVDGERVPLQTRHLVKELIKLMRETFPKNIDIKSNLPPDLWLVRGDATQIHQVLMNLCVNARDALTCGGVLRLTAANRVVDEALASMITDARPGNYVALTVADTGAGMSAAVMERVFEPFFTTKEVGKGSGLGLPTVLGIVRSHGGFIQVASEVGRGSQFEVFLPADVGAEAAGAAVTGAAAPRGDGECILLVDDEKSIRDVFSRFLTVSGYQVLAAADGVEGLTRFVEHRDRITLVLSDLMMPMMDGLAMIRAIRKLDPTMRVLVSTGLMVGGEMEAKVEELKQMGVTDFLQKPYTNHRLLEALHNAMHRAG